MLVTISSPISGGQISFQSIHQTVHTIRRPMIRGRSWFVTLRRWTSKCCYIFSMSFGSICILTQFHSMGYHRNVFSYFRGKFYTCRCTAPITDYHHLAPFSFISAMDQQPWDYIPHSKSVLNLRLSHFAWLCPQDSVCCARECCVAFGGPNR